MSSWSKVVVGSIDSCSNDADGEGECDLEHCGGRTCWAPSPESILQSGRVGTFRTKVRPWGGVSTSNPTTMETGSDRWTKTQEIPQILPMR